MLEIKPAEETVEMVDFGMNGKVLFSLPKLGESGVPIGIMSAFAMFYSRLESGLGFTEQSVSQAWSLLISTLADAYPDATRQLARLDGEQVRQVVIEWVQQSEAFDPKAPATS